MRRTAPRWPDFKRFMPNVGVRTLLFGLLIASLLTRISGLTPWLVLSPTTLPGLRLSAVLTNSLVTAPGGWLTILILTGLAGYLAQDLVRWWWRARRPQLAMAGAAFVLSLFIIDAALPRLGLGLLSSAIMIVWFGGTMERTWGAKRLLFFSLYVMLAANIVGAVLLWTWPNGISALMSEGAAPWFGTHTLVNGLLVAWCLRMGRQQVAILNVEGRQLVWLWVGLDVIALLFDGFIHGAMGLVAIGTAWALVDGRYRPSVLLHHLRLRQLDRRIAKRRARLKVIAGGRR